MIDHGLPNSAAEKIRTVLASYPEVEKAILYGSRAKGTFRNGSDIDLTLVGHALDPTLLLRIDNDLDDLLLPWMIDLSILSQINNPDLIAHIDRNGVVFYPAPNKPNPRFAKNRHKASRKES